MYNLECLLILFLLTRALSERVESTVVLLT